MAMGRVSPVTGLGGSDSLWDIWQHLETFLSQLGRGYYWHLVGGGRGCCYTSYSARDNPTCR